MGSALNVLVSGMVAGVPGQGGAAWAVLQYVLGLRRLGHRVVFLEPVTGNLAGDSFESSASARYFRAVADEFGLTESALWLAGSRRTVGMSFDAVERAAREADVFINISGMLKEPALTGRIPVRIYVDLDPAFTQLWQAVQGIDMGLAGHTHHVTVGPVIGTPGCTVPTCGVEWIPTLPPVVLEHWPAAPPPRVDAAWTTVGHWRGYGSVEHEGVFHGQRAHSFRQFFALPRRTRERLLPALAVHDGETADRAALAENGWELLDPGRVADTPVRYAAFIRSSKGELGVAKGGYVVSRCGWFSDRSACYLASGRPVLAQETGWSRHLPTGSGLLPFSTLEELATDVEAVAADYDRHAQAARRVAEDCLDSDVILSKLLANVGAA